MYGEDSRRKGLYLRVVCGVRKAQLQNKRVVFLTLTTSASTGANLNDNEKMWLVGHDWNILRTYLHQLYGKFDFISVITNEGNGVIHLLISGLPFILWTRIQRMWNNIHGSCFIWISKFRGSSERISNYLMSQYLSKQKCSMFRFKMSNQWICKRFVYYWRIIKNCSRDYCACPKDFYGNLIYPIKRDCLIPNFIMWLRYYLKSGLLMEYVPNHFDLDKF